ncbi:MAG: HD domain-containing protein [Solirubrobacteraceae bacterium]
MDRPRYPTFVSELPLTREALDFAGARHRGQRREADRAPFILHPLEVAHLLRGRGLPDHVVAAGVLHDVIEDADVRPAELELRFGPEVARLVAAVSEPVHDEPYAQRKALLREAVAGAERDAALIYAADKVARARELRMGLVRSPAAGEPPPDRLEHYWASLEMLERRLGDHPLVRQLRFELETLALLPPGSV